MTTFYRGLIIYTTPNSCFPVREEGVCLHLKVVENEIIMLKRLERIPNE